MEDVYRKLGVAVKLWQIEDAPYESSSIEVTEGWYNHETDRVDVEDRTIGPEDLAVWLPQTTKPSNTGVKTLVMRLVWIKVDTDKRQLNISKSTRKALLDAFGLSLAYNYFQSLITGITKLPRETTSNGPRDAFAFSYAPKLAAIWSSTRLPPPFRCRTLTQGLILIPHSPSPIDHIPKSEETNPEERATDIFRQTLASGWDTEVLCTPVFPAYLIALLLGIQIDLTQQNIKQKVRRLEARTGYHEFQSKREERAEGSMQQLSAQASGMATKLASVERKSKMVDMLLNAVSNEVGVQKEDFGQKLGGPTRHSREQQNTTLAKALEVIRGNVAALRYRHDVQVLDTEYIEKRVEIQIQALFHMIAQDDALSSLILSRQMSRTAEFSYRDAASMKTLAVVTMFFLPGSFVSALFSTDLFAWDDVDAASSSAIGVPTTPQMTLYWVVTIPLTVVTFVLYFLWLLYQKSERKKNLEIDEKMYSEAAPWGHGEGLTNAWRRQTFVGEENKYSNVV